MVMRIFKASLQLAIAFFLALAAVGLVLYAHRVLAAVQPATQPQVQGIAIHKGEHGAVIIDISVTKSVPYRTLQLSNPDRLVVDLEGTRESSLKGEYPAQSPLLKRVRTGQWKNNPAVVRVVADLKGNPSFHVTQWATKIRVELKPRGAASEAGSADTAATRQTADALEPERQADGNAPSPNNAFQVHRFKDLSASLTAPVLPSHDKLVPVGRPDMVKPRRKEASPLALVSGISIQPGREGGTTVEIASSKSVPYRVFQLANPFRLVIDLKDARDDSSQKVYSVDSPVLKRIRVGQWRPGNPSVVRVVADLQGYPVFDVHAQRPGIRIELKPRYTPGALMRNPFKFKTEPQKPRDVRHATPSNPAATAGGGPPAAAPGNDFSNMKVIGFIEKAGVGTQAVISHNSSVYLVAQGGTFENTFTVVAISADAVEVQNTQTLKAAWITYSPR